MKIEICEQMVQSWLINCKKCQIAQTNWSISPLKDLDAYKSDIIAYIDYFVNALKGGVASGAIAAEDVGHTKEDIESEYDAFLENGEEMSFSSFCQAFIENSKPDKKGKGDIDFSDISILGRSGKAKEMQFVRQTEIDILGVELDDGQAKNIYLVDTAYHKSGLNYSDTVSTVTKKIVRAVLVSDLIFGVDIPTHIVFASPECKASPEAKILSTINFLLPFVDKRPTLKGKPNNISIELYLNSDFSNEIYLPLRNEIDNLYGDNDLFMRSMNLAKIAEKKLTVTPPAKTTGATSSSAKAGTSASRRTYSYDEKLDEAEYYLTHNTGLTQVEKDVLGINQSGTTAKNHLRELGIDTGGIHKGLLISSNIDDEIAKASGILKTTLEEIKKRWSTNP